MSKCNLQMKLIFTFKNHANETVNAVYYDVDSVDGLRGKKVDGVQGYCFYKDKLVIVYSESKGYWNLPGGGVEEGESIEQALVREIKEETNMRVISMRVIGYQDLTDPHREYRQARFICLVEPYGDFVRDPDGGEITEIKLIEPKNLKKYLDWGEVGDHCLERAIQVVRLIT